MKVGILRGLILTMGCVIQCTARCAAAQPVTVVPSRVTCPTCRIELTRKTTLGGEVDSISPSDFLHSVIRDSRGRYYLAPTTDFTTIAVYDSVGRLLRTVGRAGTGPGEFGLIRSAKLLRGDSLLLIDEGNRRLTLLTPAYTYARAIPIHGQYTRVFQLGAQLVAGGSIRAGSSAGLPLHAIGADGSIAKSFGNLRPEPGRRDRDQASLRLAHVVGDRQIWTARIDRYELELWDLDGRLLRTLRRHADWYPPYDYSTPYPNGGPPRPLMQDLWVDTDGRLWTLSMVPTQNSKLRIQREQALPPFEVQDANLEAVIEVIDVKNGVLLASQRFDPYLVGVVAGEELYSLRATPDGDLRVDIWKVQLRRR